MTKKRNEHGKKSFTEWRRGPRTVKCFAGGIDDLHQDKTKNSTSQNKMKVEQKQSKQTLTSCAIVVVSSCSVSCDSLTSE